MRIASRDCVACLLLLLICVQFVLVLRVLSLAFKDCAQVTLPRPGLCSTAYLCASTDVLLGSPRLVHTNTHYPRIPMLTHAIVLRGSSVVDHRSSTTSSNLPWIDRASDCSALSRCGNKPTGDLCSRLAAGRCCPSAILQGFSWDSLDGKAHIQRRALLKPVGS